MRKFLLPILAAAVIFTPACKIRSSAAANPSQADTLAAVRSDVPILKEDKTIEDAARILAGMTVADDSPVAFWMEKAVWKQHKTQMDTLWGTCNKTLQKVRNLAESDFADINDRVKDVYYPFSGPDIAYAASFYPKASTYWLFALENTGSVPDLSRLTDEAFGKYRYALLYHLQNSYFITLRMASDLDNSSIDGTIPLLLVFLVRMNYHIASVTYKSLTPEGELVDSEKPADAVEIAFFNREENKLKTINYISGNIKNRHISEGLIKVFEHFPQETTAGYTKSCSYCMHRGYDWPRNTMLERTFAVIQDDTGVRYNKYSKDTWDVTLYGGYVKPLPCFDDSCYQSDLDYAYHHRRDVKPLHFRHGYNRPSSLIVARKK